MDCKDTNVRPPQRALTHAGVFHADDVFTAALLRILNPDIAIERSNQVPDAYEGLVFDIGGGEFDHHAGTMQYRENGVPYASFGLVWRHFGTLLLCEEDAAAFDQQLVQLIDLTDNMGQPNPLSQAISDFNPEGFSNLTGFDEAFARAVNFAQGVLERRIAHLKAERTSLEEVSRLMQEGDGRILVLPQAMRWRHALVGSGYLVIVYPSLRGGYNVQCVPESLDTTTTIVSAPEAWRGTSSDELKRISGVDDLTFCHQTGYLCATETLAGAMHVAQLITGNVVGIDNQQQCGQKEPTIRNA